MNQRLLKINMNLKAFTLPSPEFGQVGPLSADWNIEGRLEPFIKFTFWDVNRSADDEKNHQTGERATAQDEPREHGTPPQTVCEIREQDWIIGANMLRMEEGPWSETQFRAARPLARFVSTNLVYMVPQIWTRSHLSELRIQPQGGASAHIHKEWRNGNRRVYQRKHYKTGIHVPGRRFSWTSDECIFDEVRWIRKCAAVQLFAGLHEWLQEGL